MRRQASEPLEQLEVFDLGSHLAIAGRRVVIGEGQDVDASGLRPAHDIEIAYIRFLVVSGGRGMYV